MRLRQREAVCLKSDCKSMKPNVSFVNFLPSRMLFPIKTDIPKPRTVSGQLAGESLKTFDETSDFDCGQGEITRFPNIAPSLTHDCRYSDTWMVITRRDPERLAVSTFSVPFRRLTLSRMTIGSQFFAPFVSPKPRPAVLEPFPSSSIISST